MGIISLPRFAILNFRKQTCILEPCTYTAKFQRCFYPSVLAILTIPGLLIMLDMNITLKCNTRKGHIVPMKDSSQDNHKQTSTKHLLYQHLGLVVTTENNFYFTSIFGQFKPRKNHFYYTSICV